ncbi:MAG: hypothetical protein DRG78_15635 [Epsilonproteobacteria bacterium]|nr:MAG: hypothetical protein DRG78_15635 [Campylobacterota bacterium]
MKYLVYFSGILVTLLAVIYTVAFTSFGNNLLKPIVESKIKEQTKLASKVNRFELSMSEFNIVIDLVNRNALHVEGTYSLFSKSFDIKYNIRLTNLKSLEPLVGSPIAGAFHTNGTVKGDMKFMKIDGKSDVGDSDTSYHVELTDMNPTSIVAKIKEAKLESLLHMSGQSPYASAIVNLDVNFKNIKAHALDGDISLITKNGKLNPKIMKDDFNITIPKTSFDTKLDAKLSGDDVDYNYQLMSNLFNASSSGKVVPTPLKADIKYALDIKELALLKPITGADVRGNFRLDGNVVGTKAKLVLNGKSDVASSDTKFEAILKDFKPASIKANIKNLRLAYLLYMIKQPHYTDGVFSMTMDIKDARTSKLDGLITTKIKKGLLDSKYMTKAYEFKSPMPRTTFTMATTTKLNGSMIDSKIDLDSTLANFDIRSARLDMKDSSLNSDYVAKIPNLDKLFFVTEQHMKGGITVNGDLSKAKDLDFTMHTKVANGTIDAKLHNDDLHADLVSVQTMGLLRMLTYPEIFKSSLNAKVDYNLAQKKGVVKGDLLNGHFVENKTFNLIKKHVKFDMYKETFAGDVSAKINKEKILASLDLHSSKSFIKTKDAKLNTKTKKIDADLAIKVKKYDLEANLKGDINKPKVTINLEKFMKSRLGDKVNKEVNRLFKKLF